MFVSLSTRGLSVESDESFSVAEDEVLSTEGQGEKDSIVCLHPVSFLD